MFMVLWNYTKSVFYFTGLKILLMHTACSIKSEQIAVYGSNDLFIYFKCMDCKMRAVFVLFVDPLASSL